ncbi:MAG: methyltransferase domain-containing protein [Actinobacteria bacterium]|nr:MAG: methyltransferase domain-containing protein [Actinomycetota bacterium]
MHVCTIIAKNYVAAARVLAESFHAHNPGGTCSVLVIDGHVDAAAEPFEVVTIPQLGIERFERMAALYTVLELATAVKPWLLRHLLAQNGTERVVYLDPDIQVFDSLQEVDELLREHHLVINPHLTEPMPRDSLRPSETDILIAGAYNLGFVGLAAGRETDEMLDWWSERLESDCVVAPERGLFVDQRWMDFAPGLVPDLFVLRDPGYNVAYWNLPTRRVRREGERYTANGSPLRFFHFSGYDPERPEELSRHQNRVRLSQEPALREICDAYRDALFAHGHAEASQWPYAYDRLANDFPMDKIARGVYRRALSAGQLRRGLFDARGSREFVAYLTAPADAGGDAGVNRYLHELWRSRPDLRDAFPNLDGPDGARYASWAAVSGRVEVPIAAQLLAGHADGLAGSAAGVNVVGYFKAVLGVGEHARQLVSALESQDIPVAPINLLAARARQDADGPKEQPPRYPVNLVCVNADVFADFANDVGADFFDGRHTIGYWAWEVNKLPERLVAAFDYVDEVWVGSRHTAEALMPASPVPVFRLPQPLSLPDVEPPSREQLELPDGRLFLFSFDYNSVFDRKNPLAVIAAFRRAFAPGGGASLVVKCISSEYHPQEHERLLEASSEHPDVHILDRYLSSAERDGLVAACDCYVSLHRAEGFGYTLAEAMWLRKPVIATGYSGNLDYMTPANSYLVDYQLVAVDEGRDPYPPDAEWAEPNIEGAAAAMREVFDRPEEARARGERAGQDIRRTHSPQAAGRVMAQRLQRIAAGYPLSRRTRLPSSFDVDRISSRVEAGPSRRARSRLGGPQRAARKAVLRLMKPYTAHQQMIDRELVRSMGTVDQKLSALLSTLGDARSKLDVLGAHVAAADDRLDDLSGQVDELRTEQREASRFLASFGLADQPPERAALALEDYPEAPERPWTPEWVEAHRAYVSRALDDPALLMRFKRAQPLPPGFGVGYDERVIEFPWTLTRDLSGRLLDAGSTLNHPHVLMRVRPRVDELHIVTLSPEDKAYPFLDVSYLFEDLRSLPVADSTYDCAVSISTLEHVGMDTTHFGLARESAADPDAELAGALHELRRVLKPGGALYITVPFGVEEDFGWMRQFSAEGLKRLVAAFGPATEVSETFYRYEPSGWQQCEAAEAAASRYRDHIADPEPAADRAVAARAVACVQLRK